MRHGSFATDLQTRKAKPEKWAKQLGGLEEPWEGDTAAWLAERSLPSDLFTSSLGTIGMGNHFAELLRLQDLHNEETFSKLGLDPKCLVLLVHSGSRGLGQQLLRSHVDRFRDAGLHAGSDEAQEYLQSMTRLCAGQQQTVS